MAFLNPNYKPSEHETTKELFIGWIKSTIHPNEIVENYRLEGLSVDLIFKKYGIDHIVEVKSHQNSSHFQQALGQVLTYSMLYAMKHPDRQIEKWIVIGDSNCKPWIKKVCKGMGVKLYLKSTWGKSFHKARLKREEKVY